MKMDGPRLAGIAAVALATVAIVGNLIAVPMMLNKTAMISRKVQGGMAEFKTMSDRAWSEMMTIRSLQDSSVAVDRSRRQDDYEKGGRNLNNAAQNELNSGEKENPSRPLEELPAQEGDGEEINSGSGSLSQSGCPAGPPGPAGQNGDDGEPGDPGQDGLPGMSTEEQAKHDECIVCPAGPRGPVGAPGLPGPLGEKGDTGDAGSPATDGFEGDVGEPGFPGNPGTSGKVGKKGPNGRAAPGGQGEPGPKGAPGPIGRSGEQGARGNKNFLYGPPGATGKNGTQGLDGMAGNTGPRGKKGPPGQPGSDAQYCPCPREFEYIDKNGEQRKYTEDKNGPAQPTYTENGNKLVAPVQIPTQPIPADNNENAETPVAPHENVPAQSKKDETNYIPRRAFGTKTVTAPIGDAVNKKDNLESFTTERQDQQEQQNAKESKGVGVHAAQEGVRSRQQKPPQQRPEVTNEQEEKPATESQGLHEAQEGVRSQQPPQEQEATVEQERQPTEQPQGLHEAVGGVRPRKPQEEEERVTQETTLVDTTTGTVLNDEATEVFNEQVEEEEEEITAHTRRFVYLTKRPPFIYTSPPPSNAVPTTAGVNINANQRPQQLWPQVQPQQLNLAPQFQPSQQQSVSQQQPLPPAAPIFATSNQQVTQANNGGEQLLKGPTPPVGEPLQFQPPAPVNLPLVQGVVNAAIPLPVQPHSNPVVGAPSFAFPSPASPPDTRPLDLPVQPATQFDAKNNQQRIGIWS